MNEETKIIKQEEIDEKTQKPKKKGIFRSIIRYTFNVKRMVSSDQITATTKSIAKTAKSLFIPGRAKYNETFAQAVERLNLTEEDIKQRTQQFLKMTIFYGVFALLLFIYGIYLMFNGRFMAIFACYSITILLTVNAWREHFWYMQTKKRKLGCTLIDWVSFILGKDGEKL